jgi:hypothetical protein
MKHTTNRRKVPQGMALLETANGRWYLAFTPLTETPHWVTILDEGARFVPPAREPASRPDPQKGYGSRKKALEACRRWNEDVTLPVQWDILAARIEAYPERNAWYLDEIAQMTDGGSALCTCGVDATALVMVELHPNTSVIIATGVSLDEAIERLYEKVYEWWLARTTRHACAS